MSQIPLNLNKWIQQQLDTYKEKPRRGVPRGKPYAFPKRKYHAALLHLAHTKTFDLREIAKEAGVSYSLLLKWRTEKRFKRVILKECDAYRSVTIDLVLSRNSDWDSALQSIVNEASRYCEFLRLSFVIASAEIMKKYLERAKGGGVPEVWDMKSILIMLTFSFYFHGIYLSPGGSKEHKLDFWERQNRLISSDLGQASSVFKQALEKDWKDIAQRIFDMTARFAENEANEIIRLRKKLIERGLE